MTLAAAASGQFGDVQTVTATLKKKSDNSPVAGKIITASLAGGKAGSARTDSKGVARIRIEVKRNAGKTTVSATFRGDTSAGSSSASRPFTVVVEKTILKATGSKGTVTATLTDDDRPKATKMTSRIVTFTYSGKKVNVRTDRNGVAKLSGIKPGTTVKVTYAGVKSQYAASSATTKA